MTSTGHLPGQQMPGLETATDQRVHDGHSQRETPWEPLRPTTARWRNRRRTVKAADGIPTEKWAKVLAHRGGYEQFRYGMDHPSDWSGRLQWCVICSIESGVIAVDIDDEAAYMTTRTSGFVGRAQAISVRGPGYHAIIDARGVPADRWPKQGPIAGADVKSRGFIPVPGSRHWSDERYEPVLNANGRTTVVTATIELIAAVHADQADAKRKRKGKGGGNGGNGQGHDGEVAATVLGNVLRGLSREQCYLAWLKVATARKPDWPYDDADFERHYNGAARKAAQIRTDGQQFLRSVPQSRRHGGV